MRLTAIVAVCVAVALVAAGCLQPTLELPIEVQNADGVGAVAFELVYDAALLEVTDVNPKDLARGAQASYNDSRPGRLLFAVQNAQRINGDGTLVAIEFNVLESTGESQLALENVQARILSTGEYVTVQTTEGRFRADDESYVAPKLIFGQ